MTNNKEIILEKLPSGQLSFRTTDFESLYKEVASQDERDKFVDMFLDSFCNAYGISKNNIGFINALKNQLINYGSKGFKANNPFLQWIVQYSDHNGEESLKNITDDIYNNLISLYGNNTIVDKDLRGNGSRKTETPIFVKDFFTKSLKDMSYITKLFYWFQVDSGRRKLWKAFNNLRKSVTERSAKPVTEFSQLLTGSRTMQTSTLNKVEENNLIDFILFINGKFSYDGKFRDTRNIYAAVDYLNNYAAAETISSKQYNKREVNVNKFKNKEISIDKLNKENVKDLIAYIFQKYPDLNPES